MRSNDWTRAPCYSLNYRHCGRLKHKHHKRGYKLTVTVFLYISLYTLQLKFERLKTLFWSLISVSRLWSLASRHHALLVAIMFKNKTMLICLLTFPLIRLGSKHLIAPRSYNHPFVTPTRKLCYRKDDRAMRHIGLHGCPENFRESLTAPTATIPNIFHGLLFGSTLWMFLQNLKSVALPLAEIIGGTQKIGHSPDTPTLPFLRNF